MIHRSREASNFQLIQLIEESKRHVPSEVHEEDRRGRTRVDVRKTHKASGPVALRITIPATRREAT